MNAQTIGQVAALGTAICWAVTSLSFEAAGRRVGSLSVNLIRLILALVMFAVYGLAVHGAPFPVGAGRHVWIWLSLSGLVGFVMGDLFLFQAFVDVGARTAMLIYSLVPPMTAVIGRLVLDERLTPAQLLAMGLTVCGVVIVTTKRTSEGGGAAAATYSENAPRAVETASRPHVVRGIWFAILGSLGQALGLVLSRYGAPEYDPFAATQIRTLVGLAGFSVLFFVTHRWGRVAAAFRDVRAMRHIARGALFGPFLGVSLGLAAAQRAGTGIASTIIATVPVILIPVSIFVLKERISIREVVGACLAVGGVALFFR